MNPLAGDTGPGSGSRRAVFIDRDGVINEDRGFVHRIEDLVLIPGAVDALRQLQEAGYLLVVITNQSGIARGLYTEADYQAFTRHLVHVLASGGVTLDAIEHCPHLPDAHVLQYRMDCACRKPRPGMILRAAGRLGIELSTSILIGDRISDVQAGRSAGVGRCFLVRSGSELEGPGAPQDADGVYEDLAACSAAICCPVTQRGT